MSDRFETALMQWGEYARTALKFRDIEGNKLDAYDPALLEMFERRNTTPEECIAWLKHNSSK